MVDYSDSNNEQPVKIVFECKNLLKNSRLGAIFLLNKDGIILDISKGVENTYGYELKDLKGKYFGLLFTEEDQANKKPETELASTIRSGSGTDKNYIVHKNGDHIWTEGESVFVSDEKEGGFIIKNVYSLNRQKMLQEELTKRNDQLTKGNNDLNTFVYTASHDLKAPINNIDALTTALYNSLIDESQKSPEVIQIMNMIRESIETFKATINDLATIGREQEEDNENKDELRFSAIVDETKVNLNELITESEAVFIEDFANAPTLMFSKKNLRSILQNLISNAIKYRSPHRKPVIMISSEDRGEYILLKVADNGIGIREEDKDKLFAIYHRLNNKEVEGTGVGLNIVKRIIDNNEGRIEIESEPDKGSTFTIFFKKNTH